MNNDFFNFCIQQQGAGQRVLDKPTFYRDFILDPQLNGPRSVGILPSMTRIGPDISFTRTLSATFINQEGNIQIVNNNVPRFEWENHRTNLLSASNNFSSSAWIGYWPPKSPQWRQDAVGPDGVANSAWSLPLSAAIYSPTSNSTGLIQENLRNLSLSIRPLSGTPITTSIWARADDTSFQYVSFGIDDTQSSTINVTTSWKRFSYTGISKLDRGLQIYFLSGANTNPNSKLYLYGAQCEVGSTATSYISTDARPVTVSQPKGLLIEEQKTNFVGEQNLFNWIPSSNTLSAGSGIAGLPSFIIGDENNTQYGQVIYNFPTVLLSATTYCFSCYVKKNLNFNNVHPLLRVNFSPGNVAPQNFAGLFINQATGQVVNGYTLTTSAVNVQDFGTYYRTSFTFNSQSSANAYQINLIPSHAGANLSGTPIEVAGIQVEQGTFPTSYIPTYGSQATRTSDNAVVDGSNFTNFYNNKEGTLFVEGQAKGQRVSLPALVSIDNNTANERMLICRSTYDSVGTTNLGIITNNINQVIFAETVGIWPESSVSELALTYKINDAAATFNGQLISTNTVTMTALPKANQLQIGNGPNSAILNGHIRKVGYWPKRLSNTTLRALTLSSLALGKYFAEENSLYIGPGPGVEVTRTSSATYFASGGKLTTAFYNRPRFDYDPVTNVSRGLLIEEQRTNSIRNSQAGGSTNGVIGSGGVMPTNWAITTTANGVNTEILATGMQNGLAYIDIKISGTPTSSSNIVIRPETATQVVAAVGQTWTASAYVQLLAGSLANTSLAQYASGRTVDGAQINSDTIANTFTPTSASLATQRFSNTRTFADATVARVLQFFFLPYTSGQPIDLTLRIAAPQLEQGAFPTSYIPTTNAQATRTADTVQINSTNWQRIYNPEQGTFYTKVLPLSGSQAAAVIDVGDSFNSIHGIWKSGPGGDGSSGTSWNAFSFSDFLSANAQLTPLTANFVSTAGVANSGSGIAYTYDFNNFNASVNGSLSTIITQSTAVSAIPVMTGFNHLNGHVQTLEYYPFRLTNAQLTALTIQ